jgi:hypothetical protein
MKTELFTTATTSDKIMMIDPEGCDQNEDILQLIKQREEIDEEILKLVKQRKEFNDLIIKNCNHPIEKRAVNSWYLTDTIGNNGWDELRLICRDCGKTLKDGRSYEDIWKKSKLNYFNIGTVEMETIIKAGKDGECLLDLRNIMKLKIILFLK